MRGRTIYRFASRHDQLLTVLGALTIFVAFVTKDVYRESLGEEASSINAVRASFTIEEHLAIITERIRVAEDKQPVSSFMGVGDMNYRQSDLEDFASYFAEQVRYEKLRLLEAADQVSILSTACISLRGLPHQLSDTATENGMEIKRLLDVVGDLEISAYNFRVEKVSVSDQEKLHEDILRANERLSAVAKAEAKLADSVEGLKLKTLSDLESARESTEKNNAHAKMLSVVLFILGWGLSLVGKILKLPSLEKFVEV